MRVPQHAAEALVLNMHTILEVTTPPISHHFRSLAKKCKLCQKNLICQLAQPVEIGPWFWEASSLHHYISIDSYRIQYTYLHLSAKGLVAVKCFKPAEVLSSRRIPVWCVQAESAFEEVDEDRTQAVITFSFA